MAPPPGLYSGTSTLALVNPGSISRSVALTCRILDFEEFIESFVCWYRFRLLVLRLSGWVSSTATSSSRL